MKPINQAECRCRCRGCGLQPRYHNSRLELRVTALLLASIAATGAQTRVRPDWVINVEAAAALLPKSGNSARRLLRCSKPATRRAGLKIAFRLAQREMLGANVN
jgi:hypothetical protein